MLWYQIADIVLTILHVVVTFFNLIGWAFERTRRLHLITILLTLGSWVIPGFFYGFGYCFLTDWQWRIKRKLGETDLPDSFIKYALDNLLNADFSPLAIDIVTVIGLIFALVMTFIKNRDLWKKER